MHSSLDRRRDTTYLTYPLNYYLSRQMEDRTDAMALGMENTLCN